jgi:hypothetical protein
MLSTIGTARKRIFISLLIVTPTGFLFKLYSGPAQGWFNNYGAGVMYTIFWCLVCLFFWPRKEMITKIAVGVFLVTCSLEILQLRHTWVLEQIRSTFLGAVLIGTTFTWWDFPHYLLGCTIGCLLMHRLLNVNLSILQTCFSLTSKRTDGGNSS